jgi:hypothetical protein
LDLSFERVTHGERSIRLHAEHAFQLEHGGLGPARLEQAVGLHSPELNIQQVALERWRGSLFDARPEQVELVLYRCHEFVEEREISNCRQDVAVSRADFGCQQALAI